MPDVFRELERLTWRGIEVPVVSRSASFAHDNVRHKFSFRNGEIVEATGAQNWTFSYTIPFREGIAKGPYKGLFTETLGEFIRACRDKTPGTLIDPVLGAFRARCTSLTDDSDPVRRDGDDVRVEFVHAPEDEFDAEAGAVPTIEGIESEAGLLDEELTRIDYEQETPPEPTVNPISAIAGVGRQIDQSGQRFVSALNEVAFRAEQVNNVIVKLQSPDNWPVQRASRRLRMAALDTKKALNNPLRRIVRRVIADAKTVSAVASDAGMTVKELLEINPGLARSPEVPPGTTVSVYQRPET